MMAGDYIDICQICHKRVRHFCIQLACKSCKSLYHAKCMNLNRNDIDQINDPWYCSACIASTLPCCHIDDEGEFHAAIAECFFSSSAVYKDIDEMIFNPFEINDQVDTPLTEIDPDLQFYVESQYVQSTNCDYYIEENFVSKISSCETRSSPIIDQYLFCQCFQNYLKD